MERSGGDQPDVSLLVAGDDRLLVLAIHGDRGKAPTPATGVTISLPGVRPRAVFRIPASTVVDGRMRSGPVPLDIQAADDGCRLTLGTVADATPVLLTNGCGPLLSLDLPATTAPGATAELLATCRNPSPSPLTATIALLVAGQEAAAAITVPAWEEATVRLPVAASRSGRLPVNAEVPTADGRNIRGIPVVLLVP